MAGRWGEPVRVAYALSALMFVIVRLADLLRGGKLASPWLIPAALEVVLLLVGYRTLSGMRRAVDRGPEVEARLGWWKADGAQPSRVAILIPTLDEDVRILERTLIAATRSDHPEVAVWVLDDGDRPAVRALAEVHGCGYLSRRGGAGAKAGNLNAALAAFERDGLQYDFVAVLDADFVAERSFVSRTLALMYDASIGLVQTPQFFFNPDNFQAALPGGCLPDVMRFNHDLTQVCKDAEGAGICTGTSFLIRVAALRSIGGFPTASVTEDLLLALELRRSGWQVVYLDELLSFGIAPDNLRAFTVQRRRWDRGFVQIARIRWRTLGWARPFAGLAAVEAQMRFAYGPLVATCVLMEPALLWLPSAPALTPAGAVFGLAALATHHAYLTALSGGRFLPVYREAIAVTKALCGAPAWVAEVLRPGAVFKATPKDGRGKRVTFHPGVLTVVLTLLITLSTATALGLSREPLAWSSLIVLGWSLYSALSLLLVAAFCIELPERRGAVRFASGAEVLVRTGAQVHRAKLENVSEGGASVCCADAALAPGGSLEVWLGDDCGWLSARGLRGDGGSFAVRFELAAPRERRALLGLLYSTSFVRPVMGAGFAALARGLAWRLVHVTAW